MEISVYNLWWPCRQIAITLQMGEFMFHYGNILLIILCLSFVGCNPKQESTPDKPQNSENQTQEDNNTQQEKKVEFTTISQGANSGHNDKKDYVITNEDEWKKLWAQVHANVEPKPELPKIDFEKETVLAVFKGQQSSGGNSISITDVMAKGDVCSAQVKEVSPDPGGMMSMGFSQPYHIVKVPKMEAKVSFMRK